MKEASNLIISRENNRVTAKIKPSIYPLDTIYGAAYIFMDRAYVLLDGNPDTEVSVELIPKRGYDLDTLGMEFNNELLNYATYKEISTRNSAVRLAIIQRAFFTGDISECPEESENLDYLDDPEGISIPWEEKYQQKEEEK